MRPRLHNATFHHCEDKFRERGQVHVFWKAIARTFQALFDGGGPAVEVIGEAFVNPELFFGNLQCEPSDRATVDATSGEQISAIELQNSEDAFEGILKFVKDGLDHNWHERLNVELQDGEEQFFFRFEEIIEATGVGFGAQQDFGDASGGVAAKPEQIKGTFDDAVARGFDSVIRLYEYSTKRWQRQ